MNRLERLINLVAALLDADRPLSRHELTVLVPGYDDNEQAARRAFERDKEALRAMGIPITVEVLDPEEPTLGDGYRIPREQYELPDPDLTADELAALHLAASTVRLEGSESQAAIWKLGGSADVDAVAAAALEGNEHLPVLFGAVSERRTVRFAYRGSERTVDPYRLAYRNGFWYLAGFDRDKGSERSFRLDRFESAPLAGEPKAFERPSTPATRPVHPWEMGEEDERTARVWVDVEQAMWAEAKVGADAVVERGDDGSVVVELRVTNTDAFRTFVLGFLDHAEVLASPDLRDDMIAWLQAV
ncbi:MAG TPA: WYL domain-containing protein [Acidimicrobiales bacterium]|nr:WYL domain-containing protein [Acidimicrobiales bacterium]